VSRLQIFGREENWEIAGIQNQMIVDKNRLAIYEIRSNFSR